VLKLNPAHTNWVAEHKHLGGAESKSRDLGSDRGYRVATITSWPGANLGGAEIVELRIGERNILGQDVLSQNVLVLKVLVFHFV
jgi:hypothetical protein